MLLGVGRGVEGQIEKNRLMEEHLNLGTVVRQLIKYLLLLLEASISKSRCKTGSQQQYKDIVVEVLFCSQKYFSKNPKGGNVI